MGDNTNTYKIIIQLLFVAAIESVPRFTTMNERRKYKKREKTKNERKTILDFQDENKL